MSEAKSQDKTEAAAWEKIIGYPEWRFVVMYFEKRKESIIKDLVRQGDDLARGRHQEIDRFYDYIREQRNTYKSNKEKK